MAYIASKIGCPVNISSRLAWPGLLLPCCFLLATLTLPVQPLIAQADAGLPEQSSTRTEPRIDTPSFGYIDTPKTATFTDPSAHIDGWVLDAEGIARVLLRVDGKLEIEVPYGLIRNDVAQVHPNLPNAELSGFSLAVDLTPFLADHSQLDLVAIDNNNNETVIDSRFVINPDKMNKWSGLFARNRQWANDPFYVLHATSGVANGGAGGLADAYSFYSSKTIPVGLRVPILYMRSTLGKNEDWVFDPGFDVNRTDHNKRLVDDSLQTLMDFSIATNLPVLFTLNGGVWADAFGTAPEWDLNDHLEENPQNCQWSQFDEVFADDYLKNLAGSTESPELARVLTLNSYATDVRNYKKRNLQEAGAIIRQFQLKHPTLVAGINLDADTYANPFFADRWHDYNPQTIRQFREWLQGNGLYSADGPLSAYRRDRSFTLEELNLLAGKQFASWDEVDPPRDKPSKTNDPALSLDQIADTYVPWIRQWELFRRHLVDLHYDELSLWLNEIGIRPDDIYSSQGFSAPHARALPFAVHLDSPVTNYDSGGMSIEGSVPRGGHLGVIIYGASSSNNIRMETDTSLFEAFYKADPDWGVVEYNTSDFKDPGKLADYARAYRSLRDLYNYQTRFVSAMAWNGSNGKMVGMPGFAAHTALQQTPMELAMKDFMVSHALLPRNALMWEFGTVRHLDFDRWTASQGSIGGDYGSLVVKSEQDQAVLVSPARVPIKPQFHNLLVLGITQREALEAIEVFAQTTDGKKSISGRLAVSDLGYTAAGIEVPVNWQGTATWESFEISLSFNPAVRQFRLDHVALVPNGGSNTEPADIELPGRHQVPPTQPGVSRDTLIDSTSI